MKKSDLKTGMIVTTRNGVEYVVLLNTVSNYIGHRNNVLVNPDRKWISLDRYNEDLIMCDGFKALDIMKIKLPAHPYGFMDFSYDSNNKKLLWEREVKEMTMEELEEHFGCKVKIIK